MKKNKINRKDFLKKSAVLSAGVSLGLSAKSYGNILGANDKLRFAVVGLNGRGQAHLQAISQIPNAEISYLCDVDSRVLEKSAKTVEKLTGKRPQKVEDYRELVEKDDLDAITIATPGHWHAPMTLMAVANGKQVYIEKPCAHNPREAEMLVEAQQKYGAIIQMGNQQRSALTSIQAVKDIRNGIIGNAYMGKAWYCNTRGSIGHGQQATVPDWLNWELWQGPAPRREYRNNIVHYNWHWFRNWGTGEIHNNGTHEMDVCRWALGVDYPDKATSSGGRYHFDDDWQFYDTQVASFEFGDDKMISWEGKSCNGFPYHQRSRGATIHGTKGTVLLDRAGYTAYDLENKVIKELKEDEAAATATSNTVGMGNLTVMHFANFANAIRKEEALRAPIDDASISTMLCHYGNIAQKTGHTLEIDSDNGTIIDDEEAMKLWSREYEPGWEPEV